MTGTSGCTTPWPAVTPRLTDARCIEEKRLSAVQLVSSASSLATTGSCGESPELAAEADRGQGRDDGKEPRQISAGGDPKESRLHLRRRSELVVESMSARHLPVWLMRGVANAIAASPGRGPELFQPMGVLTVTRGVLS